MIMAGPVPKKKQIKWIKSTFQNKEVTGLTMTSRTHGDSQLRVKGEASGKSKVNISVSLELGYVFKLKVGGCQDFRACTHSLIHSSDIYWC